MNIKTLVSSSEWFQKKIQASATTRKMVNRILALKDDQGVKVTDNSGMSTIAKNYFLELFQRKISNTTLVVEAIRHSITYDDNAMLTAPFFKEEFKEAILTMHPDKCPGLDGYNLRFR